MKYKKGMSFQARTPFSFPYIRKVHILHVLPSGVFKNVDFVIYKVYSKYKKRRFELMCYNFEMDIYINIKNGSDD